MSLETIVGQSKRLEGLLKRLGYHGKGLHELVSQAELALDTKVVRACRKVATIRNKAVHEEGYRLNGQALRDFNDAADYATEHLSALLVPDPIRSRRKPDVPSQAKSRGIARPTGERRVFGRRPKDLPAEEKRMAFKSYLIFGGLAIGAAGIWFWN
jgi:hypothetical protein